MPDTDDPKRAADEAYWQSLARAAEPRADQEAPAKDAVMSQNATAERAEDKGLARRSVGRRRGI